MMSKAKFLAQVADLKKDPTVSAPQRTYMLAKAAYQTANDAHTRKMKTEFPDEIFEHNPDETLIDRYCERAEEVAESLKLPFYRAALKQAEDVLFEWALDIFKKAGKSAGEIDLLSQAFKTVNVVNRQKMIDMVMKLDASTIPA